MKTVLCLALLSIPLVSLPAPGWGQSLERQKAAVVKLTAVSDGKRKTGTGFIVRLDQDAAYILTASHVVEGDNDPEVEFFTRRNLPVQAQTARLEGGDPRGLALLIVRGHGNLPQGILSLPMEGKMRIQGGAPVTIIGFPQGAGPWAVVRATIVSLDGRDLTIDGSIDEGSSGGPVLFDGVVAGVITTVQGKFARAVPASVAKLVLEGWGVTPVGSIDSGIGSEKGPADEAGPADPGPATTAGNVEPRGGVLRILHAACEKLRSGTSYRVVLNGDGQGPEGAVLQTALWRTDRQLSAPKPSCKEWKGCERGARDPETTAWSLSTLSTGAAPTEVRVSLSPAGAVSKQTPYAVARTDLDCTRSW
jgi:hypothetical protein